MAVHYIGTNSPDGTCIGTASTEKVAFFGATPVVQQTGASLLTTVTSTATDGPLILAVNKVITALDNLGLTAT